MCLATWNSELLPGSWHPFTSRLHISYLGPITANCNSRYRRLRLLGLPTMSEFGRLKVSPLGFSRNYKPQIELMLMYIHIKWDIVLICCFITYRALFRWQSHIDFITLNSWYYRSVSCLNPALYSGKRLKSQIYMIHPLLCFEYSGTILISCWSFWESCFQCSRIFRPFATFAIHVVWILWCYRWCVFLITNTCLWSLCRKTVTGQRQK